MLDSSKFSIVDDPYGFNSRDLLVEMCAQHKIELKVGSIVLFPKGWKVIVLHFLDKLKEYPVVLFDVLDTYGQLDIKFGMKSEQGELHVWRLIEVLRVESRNTCMECGLLSNLHSVPGTYRRFCKDCINTCTKELTGTWLDKYE